MDDPPSTHLAQKESSLLPCRAKSTNVDLFSTKTKKKKDKMDYIKILLTKRLMFLCDFFKRREAVKSNCLYDKSLALLL